MYSVSETIENGKICATASPGIWIVGHILYWPPGEVDRSQLIPPEPDWTPYMCKVLRENIGNIYIM